MKTQYDTFQELANLVCRGESPFHLFSSHLEDDCDAWRLGIHEFAKWLDENNFPLIDHCKDFNY